MGSPLSFTKNCLVIVRSDLLPMFKDLYNDDLSLFYLSFRIITLLSKKMNVARIEF